MVQSATGLQSIANTAVSCDGWLAALPCVPTAEQLRVMRQAFALAQASYRDMTRVADIAAMDYAQQVAMLVAQLGLDADAIMAGLLYGLPQQTDFDRPQLAEQLGDDVVTLIEGVARVDALSGMRQTAQRDGSGQLEALRKMLLAMARDIRVVCIALVMRVVDLRQLPYKNAASEMIQGGQDLARQTLALYAPLANRLGVTRLKWELEDLSLRLLEPQSYHAIARSLAATRRQRER